MKKTIQLVVHDLFTIPDEAYYICAQTVVQAENELAILFPCVYFSCTSELSEEHAVIPTARQGCFHLSGTVQETQGICLQRKVCHYKVSLKFDRCKITSVQCTCNNRTILWCAHAVALAICRIRHASSVRIRVPISEGIMQLKTTELQSLLLHLITQHHQDILPSVQNLLDDLKRPDSEISRTAGLPDPTAGACSGSDSLWYLDSELIKEEIKTGLEPNNTGKNINSLLNKVREMFYSGDNNASQLLHLITESFMDSMRTSQPLADEPTRISDKTRKLWDCLSLVWLCATLNPSLASDRKQEMRQQLAQWHRQQRRYYQQAAVVNREGVLSVFDMPLAALEWTYSSNEDDVIRAAAFADAFRCHGLNSEAVQIATRIAEKLRQISTLNQPNDNRIESSRAGDSWLVHNIDPISIIFDILSSELEKNDRNRVKYLQLAVHVAFAGLGQVKSLPSDKYEQLRLCHREEQLLTQLEDFDFSSEHLRPIICRFCEHLQTLSHRNSRSMSPSHSFTRFLFNKTLLFDKKLAYSFSIPLLALSPSIDGSDGSHDDDNDVCHILPHLEAQQCELAAKLLRGCHNDADYITSVVGSIKAHIKNSSQLFRLAKLASSVIEENCEGMSHRVETELQRAAVELGTKAVQVTLNSNAWDRHEMVRWLVSSSVLRGKQAVFALFLRWRSLFTAEEVCKDVATMLSSHTVLYKLQMGEEEEQNFMTHLRSVVIESAIHNPQSCALLALTHCECEPEAFDLACQIVNESASRLGTTQLFSIARYLESKGYLRKSLKVATLAMKQLDIGLEHETHPAVGEVFWACALASSLGKDEFTQITPILCNCVRNPVILTEIARRSVKNSSYVINSGTTSTTNNKTKTSNKLYFDKEPINRLLATAQQLFIQEVQNKLNNITPKQYTNFVLYLGKVKAGFDLVDEGQEQFQWLLDFIATTQKGRKKLQKLINDTFLNSRLSNHSCLTSCNSKQVLL
eukprot:gene7764-8610_t